MLSLLVSFAVLVSACFIAAIIDPARASAFGFFDVVLGSFYFVCVDRLWTTMRWKNRKSPQILVLRLLASSIFFWLLWNPYTSAPTGDFIWLAFAASGILYAFHEKRRGFHGEDFT